MTDRPTKEIVDGIDNVIRFLHFHKKEAVETLFKYEHSVYQEMWLHRDIGQFWNRLCYSNRDHLIELAIAHYK